MNPIFERQWRARWRSWRSFWQMTAFVAPLAALTLFALLRTPVSPTSRHALEAGHVLLSTLTVAQTLAWMLMAPALTAPTIAGERERGLLEAIQMTPLSPRRIAGGFWSSSIAFASLLSLCALPLGVLCLWLGGVSPAQLVRGFALGSATCFGGACLGSCCSAWSRRETAAVRVAMGVTLFQMISGFLLTLIAGWPGLAATPRAVLFFLSQIDPPVVALTMPYPLLNAPLQFANQRLLPGFDIDPWILCCGFEFFAGMALLGAAVIPLRRPLLPQRWLDLRWTARRAKLAASPQQKLMPLHEVSPRRWTEFSNPIMARETRAKLRMRQPPLAVIVVELLMGAAVLASYGVVLFAAWFPAAGSALVRLASGVGGFQFPVHEVIWSVAAWMGLSLLLPACTLMGALSIARDREIGVWQDIKLTLLTPGEILWGKLGALMWTCGLFSLPAWPLLLPGVRATLYQAYLSDPADARNGVPYNLALALVALLFGVACACGAWGLLVSWFCNTVNRAVQIALLPLLALLGVPLVFAFWYQTPLPWHPGWVLWNLLRIYKTQALWPHCWLALLTCLMTAIFCLGTLWFLLRREQNS